MFARFDVPRWRTRPGPEWTVRSFAIGHRVPYAAGGASPTGENHTLQAVDDHFCRRGAGNQRVGLLGFAAGKPLPALPRLTSGTARVSRALMSPLLEPPANGKVGARTTS